MTGKISCYICMTYPYETRHISLYTFYSADNFFIELFRPEGAPQHIISTVFHFSWNCQLCIILLLCVHNNKVQKV